MPITVTNILTSSGFGVTSRSVTFTNVVAGSTLVCTISRWPNATSTFTVDDPTHGSWTLGVDYSGVGAAVLNRYSAIWYLVNAQATASLTVTATASASSEFRITCAELLGGGLIGGTSVFEEVNTISPAYSAAVSGFNPPNLSASIGVITPVASFGAGGSLDASYSKLNISPTTRAYHISGFKIASTNLTNERMTFTPAIDRSHIGVSAYFLPSVIVTQQQYRDVIGGGIISGNFF